MSAAYFLGDEHAVSPGKLGRMQSFNRYMDPGFLSQIMAAGVEGNQASASAAPLFESDFQQWSGDVPDGWTVGGSAVSERRIDDDGRSYLRLVSPTNNTIQTGLYTAAILSPELLGKMCVVSFSIRRISGSGNLHIGKGPGSGANALLVPGVDLQGPGWHRKSFVFPVLGGVGGDSGRLIIRTEMGGSSTTTWEVKEFRCGLAGQTADYQPGALQMAPGTWIDVVNGKNAAIPVGMILGDYVPPPEGPEISADDVQDKDSAVRGLISGRRADLIAKKYIRCDPSLGGDEPSEEHAPTEAAVRQFVADSKTEIDPVDLLDDESEELGLISGRRADLLTKKRISNDPTLGGDEPAQDRAPSQAALLEFLLDREPAYYVRITESGTWEKPAGFRLFLVHTVNGGNCGSARADSLGQASGTGAAGGTGLLYCVRTEDLPEQVPCVVGAGAVSLGAEVPSSGGATITGVVGGTTTFNGRGFSNGGNYSTNAWNPTGVSSMPASGLFAGNGASTSSSPSALAGDSVWGGAGGGSAQEGSSSQPNPAGKSMMAGDGGDGVSASAPSGDVYGEDGQFPGGAGGAAVIVWGTEGQRAVPGRGADGVIDIWGIR